MCENSLDELTQQQTPNTMEDLSREEMRKKYINHEASVKSIGILYFVGACIGIVAGVVGSLCNGEGPLVIRILIALFFISLGLFQIWVGVALRSLRRWVRIPVGIFSGIGLFGFPIGTIINGYILYLIFCKKGSTVFSPEYQQIIAATPNIKYKTSVIVWIVLGLFILLIGLALFGALFSK